MLGVAAGIILGIVWGTSDYIKSQKKSKKGIDKYSKV